jgi:hypothetical protein
MGQSLRIPIAPTTAPEAGVGAALETITECQEEPCTKIPVPLPASPPQADQPSDTAVDMSPTPPSIGETPIAPSAVRETGMGAALESIAEGQQEPGAKIPVALPASPPQTDQPSEAAVDGRPTAPPIAEIPIAPSAVPETGAGAALETVAEGQQEPGAKTPVPLPASPPQADCTSDAAVDGRPTAPTIGEILIAPSAVPELDVGAALETIAEGHQEPGAKLSAPLPASHPQTDQPFDATVDGSPNAPPIGELPIAPSAVREPDVGAALESIAEGQQEPDAKISVPLPASHPQTDQSSDAAMDESRTAAPIGETAAVAEQLDEALDQGDEKTSEDEEAPKPRGVAADFGGGEENEEDISGEEEEVKAVLAEQQNEVVPGQQVRTYSRRN